MPLDRLARLPRQLRPARWPSSRTPWSATRPIRTSISAQRGLLAAELLARTVRGEIQPGHARRQAADGHQHPGPGDRPRADDGAHGRGPRGRTAARHAVGERDGRLPVRGRAAHGAERHRRGRRRPRRWPAPSPTSSPTRCGTIREDLPVACASPAEAVRRGHGLAARPGRAGRPRRQHRRRARPATAPSCSHEMLRQGARRSRRGPLRPRRRRAMSTRIGPRRHVRPAGRRAVDRLHGEPVEVSRHRPACPDGNWVEDRGPPRRPAAQRPGADGRRRPRRRGHARAQLAADPAVQPRPAHQPGHRPGTARMIVVKAAVAYKAAYAPIAAEIIEVDTPGVTAVNPAPVHVSSHRPPHVPARLTRHAASSPSSC